MVWSLVYVIFSVGFFYCPIKVLFFICLFIRSIFLICSVKSNLGQIVDFESSQSVLVLVPRLDVFRSHLVI
uniref:Uncharacterized protein n=1 Tax=Kalanchoe fedtschenkoi TaxID=63787 RepID=A0A7N0VMF9_KALFE